MTDISEQLKTVYAAIRGGKDPDTGFLHMTEEEFLDAIRTLITGVIGEDEEAELVNYNHGIYPNEDVTAQNDLRKEQRKRAGL